MMIFIVQRYVEDYLAKRGADCQDDYAVRLANVYAGNRSSLSRDDFLARMKRIRTAVFRNAGLERAAFERALLSALDRKGATGIRARGQTGAAASSQETGEPSGHECGHPKETMVILPFTRSPHHSHRKGTTIDTVVWHWTGGWRNAEDVARLDYQRTVNPVSAHFTIGRDGTIVQSVDLDRAAWHAGGGRFLPVGGKVPNMNARSIGVELCNRGYLRGADWDRLSAGDIYTGPHRNPRARSREWELYTEKQIEAVVRLAIMLEAEIPTLLYHTGHEDIRNLQHTKGAKLDPGPTFPWEMFGAAQTSVVRWDYDKRGWSGG